jgi:hypothetical protein
MLRRFFNSFVLVVISSIAIHAQIAFMPKALKFSLPNCKYTVEKVIDARADTSVSVGLLVDNSQFQLVEYESNVSSSLHDFFEFAIRPSKNSVPIAIKIHSLEYNKNYFGKNLNKELVWMFADYEVFVKQKDNTWYRLIRVKDVVEAQIFDEMYNLNFAELTWIFWNKAFRELQSKKMHNQPIDVLADDAIGHPALYPPILTDALKGGIYMSYQEFLSNNPSITDIGINENGVYKRNPKTNKLEPVKPKDRIWGFSDGYNCFIYLADNDYNVDIIPIEPIGTTFETARIAKKPYIENNFQFDKNRMAFASSMLYTAVSYREMKHLYEQKALTSGENILTSSSTPQTSGINTVNYVGAGLVLLAELIGQLEERDRYKRLVLNDGRLQVVERYIIAKH